MFIGTAYLFLSKNSDLGYGASVPKGAQIKSVISDSHGEILIVFEFNHETSEREWRKFHRVLNYSPVPKDATFIGSVARTGEIQHIYVKKLEGL